MLDMDAHARLTKAWSDAAFDCACVSVGVATTMAGSAMQLWTGALGCTANKPTAPYRPQRATPTIRSWYRAPCRSPFEEALQAWTGGVWSAVAAWQDALGMSRSWLPPMPFAAASPADIFSPWAMTIAAARAMTPWAWQPPPHPWQQMAAFWQPVVTLPQPMPVTNPFAVYRTDGGHASTQVMLPQLMMQAALQPFGSASPMQRLLQQAIRPFG